MYVLKKSTITASPLLLLVLCGLLFAFKIMISKAALSAGIKPFQLGVFGNLGAAFALLPILLLSGQRVLVQRRYLLLYAVLGFVSFAVPTVMSYYTVEKVGPAYTSTVYALSPILTMAFAAGLGVERMVGRHSLGIVLGFFGMLLLLQQQLYHVDISNPFWILAGLLIPVCAAAGNIIRSAYWPNGTSALAFSCASLFTSALFVALCSPVFENPAEWIFMDEKVLFWLGCFIAISALSYMLNFRLQEIGGAVFFSQLGYWGTCFGVILAAVLFDDVLTVMSLIGLTCIISGGILSKRRTDAKILTNKAR